MMIKKMDLFVETAAGMIMTVLFPWIAGLLSALGEVRSPCFLQTAFSHGVLCLLYSLPLCVAILYIFYKTYTRHIEHESIKPATGSGEKSA